MSELEKIQRYIDRTKIRLSAVSPYDMDMDEFTAIENLAMEKELFHGIVMAFEFGRAKGWRAAKASAKK